MCLHLTFRKLQSTIHAYNKNTRTWSQFSLSLCMFIVLKCITSLPKKTNMPEIWVVIKNKLCFCEVGVGKGPQISTCSSPPIAVTQWPWWANRCWGCLPIRQGIQWSFSNLPSYVRPVAQFLVRAACTTKMPKAAMPEVVLLQFELDFLPFW